MIRALSVAIAVAIATLPVHARADPQEPKAKAHFEAGLRHFEAKAWDLAIEELRAGYAIERDPLFLYAWAQAEYNRGDCRAAVRLYTEFMAQDVGEAARDAAREAIVVCAEILAADDETIDAVEDDAEVTDDAIDDPVEPMVAPVEPTPRRDTRPWYLDPLGDALAAVGIAAAATGGGLLIGAEIDARREYAFVDDHAERLDRVRAMRIAGAVLLGVGGALVIGGAVRWGLVARKGSRVALAPGPGRVGLSLVGRF